MDNKAKPTKSKNKFWIFAVAIASAVLGYYIYEGWRKSNLPATPPTPTTGGNTTGSSNTTTNQTGNTTPPPNTGGNTTQPDATGGVVSLSYGGNLYNVSEMNKQELVQLLYYLYDKSQWNTILREERNKIFNYIASRFYKSEIQTLFEFYKQESGGRNLQWDLNNEAGYAYSVFYSKLKV